MGVCLDIGEFFDGVLTFRKLAYWHHALCDVCHVFFEYSLLYRHQFSGDAPSQKEIGGRLGCRLASL